MRLNPDATPEQLLAAGFELGWTRDLSLPDANTIFTRTIDFEGYKPGNLVLRRPTDPAMVALVVRPLMLSDNPQDEDYTWMNALALAPDSFTMTVGSSFLIKVFSLGTFEKLRLGEVPIGRLSGATLTDRWLMVDSRVVTNASGIATATIVNDLNTILPMPKPLKDELRKVGFLTETLY